MAEFDPVQPGKVPTLLNLLFAGIPQQVANNQADVENRRRQELGQQAANQRADVTRGFQRMLGGVPVPLADAGIAPLGQQTAQQQGETLALMGQAGLPYLERLIGPLSAAEREKQDLTLQGARLGIEGQQAGIEQTRASIQAQYAARAASDAARMKTLWELSNLRNPAMMPTAQIETTDAAGNPVVRTVNTPNSPDYWPEVNKVKGAMELADKLDTITDIVVGDADQAGVGTEFFGRADEIDALVDSALLSWAQSKGMGQLQGGDERIARNVIPNPASFGENVETLLRELNPLSFLESGLQFATGSEEPIFGFTRQAQIEGFADKYAVAKREAYISIVSAIQANPLIIDNLSDEELARIPPSVLAPVMPEIRKRGRNPYAN